MVAKESHDNILSNCSMDVILTAASEECLLSAVYTFSSVALPETLNAAQLACVHGLVSV